MTDCETRIVSPILYGSPRRLYNLPSPNGAAIHSVVAAGFLMNPDAHRHNPFSRSQSSLVPVHGVLASQTAEIIQITNLRY